MYPLYPEIDYHWIFEPAKTTDMPNSENTADIAVNPPLLENTITSGCQHNSFRDHIIVFMMQISTTDMVFFNKHKINIQTYSISLFIYPCKSHASCLILVLLICVSLSDG